MDSDEKIIQLYQRTRQAQPSKALDEAILTAAKAQIGSQKSNSKRLIWAFSSVAVVVLSVNVALKVVLEPTEPYITTPQYDSTLSSDLSKSSELASSYAENANTKSSDVASTESIQAIPSKKTSSTAKFKQEKIILEKRSEKPAMLRSEPMAQQKMHASEMLDDTIKEIILPQFTFNVAKLKQSYPLHQIARTQENKIEILMANSLAVQLQRLPNNTIRVTAFPASTTLGLNIDWQQKAPPIQNCTVLKSSLKCAINPKLTGLFSQRLSRLIQVTWAQAFNTP